MLIVSFVGGLGNQMFQYAMCKALALRNGSEIRIETGVYNQKKLFNKYVNPEGFLLEKVFNIGEKHVKLTDYFVTLGIRAPLIFLFKRGFCTDLTESGFLSENKVFTFDPEILNERDGYLYGYWQSEKYFSGYQDEIKKAYNFDLSCLTTEAINFAKQVKEEQSVALHVRGSDYLLNPVYKKMYNNLAETQYYANAISMMRDLLGNPNFYIFTDDPDWVSSKDIFEDIPILSMQNDGSWNDLYVMSNCRHQVTANSSFSWWSAWLNSNKDKVVITPHLWFIDGTETPDLIPETWIKVQ